MKKTPETIEKAAEPVAEKAAETVVEQASKPVTEKAAETAAKPKAARLKSSPLPRPHPRRRRISLSSLAAESGTSLS